MASDFIHSVFCRSVFCRSVFCSSVFSSSVFRFFALLWLSFGCFDDVEAQPIPVRIAQENGMWTLTRDGKPYEIKGAGGHVHMAHVVATGGNSLRTWGIERAQHILDSAHELGLSVMLGFWMGHERHGFDYDDTLAVREQFRHFAAAVDRFKNHPALLIWGIGNEVDLFYSNIRVWSAIQDLAAYIHQVDPHHPTSTVTAGLDSMEVHWINTMAPDIDILGVNTYGDLASAVSKIKIFGWNKPYVITEWGPNGHWEVAKAPWGAPIEQSSESKYETYLERYTQYIAANPLKSCIGSYAFLWGQKQETTESWYGLFDVANRPTRSIDALEQGWKKGVALSGTGPRVTSIRILDESMAPSPSAGNQESKKGVQHSISQRYIQAYGGQRIKAEVQLLEPLSESYRFQWKILPEATNTGAGGDFEQSLNPAALRIKGSRSPQAEIDLPSAEGAYRLYVYVVDEQQKSGYANLPLYVLPKAMNPANHQRFRWSNPSLSSPSYLQ